MHGVEAAKFEIHRQRGRVLDQILIYLDDAERGPLLVEGSRGRSTRCENQSSGCLHIADTTDEPAIGAAHDVADELAAALPDVALDERARV